MSKNKRGNVGIIVAMIVILISVFPAMKAGAKAKDANWSGNLLKELDAPVNGEETNDEEIDDEEINDEVNDEETEDEEIEDNEEKDEDDSFYEIDIDEVTVSKISDVYYTGDEVTPTLKLSYQGKTLTEEEDYSLFYEDNIDTGIASIWIMGEGDFVGEREVTFTIKRRAIGEVNVFNLQNVTYSGKAWKQELELSYADLELAEGEDYRLSYKNNINAGTATITITGIGNFNGTKNVTFKIAARNVSSVKANSIKNQIYTGKALTPSVSLKWNTVTLKHKTDYKVSYSNNKATGKATITITGMGNYSGVKKVTFHIVPKKIGSVSIKNTKTKQANVSWSKVTGASGYEVVYSMKKNGSYKSVGTMKKNTATVTKLTKNKNYYFKVRAYKVIDGKNVYGEFSTPKSIKVK